MAKGLATLLLVLLNFMFIVVIILSAIVILGIISETMEEWRDFYGKEK